MMRSPVVTETWHLLGRGFSFPGAGSYNSKRGCATVTGISGQNDSEEQTYESSN